MRKQFNFVDWFDNEGWVCPPADAEGIFHKLDEYSDTHPLQLLSSYTNLYVNVKKCARDHIIVRNYFRGYD